ncbi:SpaA isopeptide-forming pilin-related protein, partial [Vagococcus xieshaowenii]
MHFAHKKEVYSFLMVILLIVNNILPVGTVVAEELSKEFSVVNNLSLIEQTDNEVIIKLSGESENTEGEEVTQEFNLSGIKEIKAIDEVNKPIDNVEIIDNNKMKLHYTTDRQEAFSFVVKATYDSKEVQTISLLDSTAKVIERVNIPKKTVSTTMSSSLADSSEESTQEDQQVASTIIEEDKELTSTTTNESVQETEEQTADSMTESTKVTEMQMEDTISEATEESQTETSTETKNAHVNVENKKNIRATVLKKKSITENLITDIKITDLKGNEFTAENPADIDKEMKISMDWNIPDGLEVSKGDTYEFNLPNILRLAATLGPLPLEGDNGTYGTFTVQPNGHVTMFFDELVEADRVSGTMEVQTWFNQTVTTENVKTLYKIPIGEDVHEVMVYFKPQKGNAINKEGAIDSQYNGKEATWTVDINTELTQLVNPVIKDTIPSGMNYVKDSLVVYALDIKVDGNKTQGQALDKSKYSVTLDSKNNPQIVFNNLSEAEQYQAYRLVYQTAIDLTTDIEGSKSFKNSAQLTNNGQTKSATSTVSTTYGKELDKNKTGYDASKQTLDWEINYNYGGKKIDKEKAVITDTWTPAGKMTLENFAIYPVTINETGKATVSQTPLSENLYTLNKATDGFTVTFKQDVVEAYKIKYKTKLTGNITANGAVNNNVTTGTKKTDGSEGVYSQQGVVKQKTGHNVTNKTISWAATLNGNGYLMDNLVITDTFSGDGLSLLEGTLVLKEKASGKTLERNKDYTLSVTEPTPGHPGGFVLSFINDYASTNKIFSLSYQTHFERNSQAPYATYSNAMNIKWAEGKTNYESNTGKIDTTPSNYLATNGTKLGEYNAIDKTIKWSIFTNYARVDLKNGYSIIDKLDDSQEYVPDSLSVFHYNIDATGQKLTKGTEIPKEEYHFEYTNNTLNVVFNREYKNPQDTTIGIEFKSKFVNDIVNSKEIINNAKVLNDDKETSLDKTVTVKEDGLFFANKSGKQNGNNISWKIELNPTGSKINDYQLDDELGEGTVLLADSFKLYKASLDAKGKITKGALVTAEEAKDLYTLTTNTEQSTGKQSFTLLFNAEINVPYILEYDTYIDVSGSADIGNKYAVKGNNNQVIQEQRQTATRVQMSGGSGTGTGIRGGIQIRKQDDHKKVLSGALFELWNKDQSVKLREGSTSEEGLLVFGGLRSGTYVLKEVKAPNNFVIPSEYAKGKTFELNVAENGLVKEFTVSNSLRKVVLQKQDASGKLIDGAVYAIYEQGTDKVVKEAVKVTDGKVTVEDLPEGNYYVKEIEAPTGYIRNEANKNFQIKVNNDGTQTIPTVTFKNYQGAAELIKMDANETPLSDAVFSVYQKGNEQPVKTDLKSNANGKVSVTNLAPGEYYFKETKAPIGYVLNTEEVSFVIPESVEKEGPVTISAGSLTNYQAEVTFIKESKEGSALSKAEFAVYREGNDLEPLKEGLVSDEAGKVIVSGLAPGEYYFKETKAPAGYLLNTNKLSFKVEDSAKGKPATIKLDTFKNYQATIVVNKTDKDGKKLANATFNLFKDKDTLVKENIVSNEDGQIIMEQLAPGQYSLVETKAPAGYVLLTTPLIFEVSDKAAGEPEVVTLSDTIKNYQGSAELVKTNAAGEPLAEAVFDVYTKEGKPTTTNVVSDKDGKVRVQHLAPGEYYFQEVKAPAGYIRNTDKVA